MTETIQETPSPQVCAAKIFEISGTQLDPDMAVARWPKILQHKWLMSEKHGRDVGLSTACIDFIEHSEQAIKEYADYRRKDVLVEMCAQTFGREIWDTISDSQPPMQLVLRRIILPLTERDLSMKHGVTPPKTIIFFGPPGTGKTHITRMCDKLYQTARCCIAPSRKVRLYYSGWRFGRRREKDYHGILLKQAPYKGD